MSDRMCMRAGCHHSEHVHIGDGDSCGVEVCDCAGFVGMRETAPPPMPAPRLTPEAVDRAAVAALQRAQERLDNGRDLETAAALLGAVAAVVAAQRGHVEPSAYRQELQYACELLQQLRERLAEAERSNTR